MSYNILNKGVNFQGATQGTIEDIVDTHSTQTINGLKTVTHLTGTNVRITNDAVVLGNISASVNISASAFYGDGANLTNVGAQINSAGENRITTVASDTSKLDAESNLTFNASTKILQLGNPLVTDTEFRIFGTISGSGNISGSAFYGDGSNLSGVQAVLKSNAGLNYDSNELEVKFDTLGTPAGGIDGTDDKILIYDDSESALKAVAPDDVAGLFNAAVTSFLGQTQHRVVTVGAANRIDGEQDLTFDGSTLTITGDVSGSGFVSASVGHFVTKIEAAAIDLDDASGIAGLGLGNSLGGLLSVETSGAIKIASDKVSITGSIAGYGLAYEGGVNSISSLKLDFGSLTDAAINRSNDFITFVDADDGEAKRDSVVDFVGFIAGSGLDASSGQLSVDVSDFMTSGSNNRIITATGTDGMTAESDVNFNSSTGVFSVRGEVHVINEAGAAGSLTVSETGSMSYLIVSGSSMTSRAIIQAPNSVPADSLLHGGSFSFFLDEGNNKLKVRVKYGDGTMKDGEISLT